MNSAEWLRRLGHLPWVTLHDDADVVWCFAGDTWPRNCAALARFEPTTARDRIRQILSVHWEHQAACNWIVGPISQPENLTKHLRDNGFSCRIHCAGMACNLESLGNPVPVASDVKIELVEQPPSLLPLTTDRRKRRHQGRAIIAAAHPQTTYYFSASCRGVPIGETALFDGETVAGIYDVEVLEKFRRRGIGSALIDAALRHARKLGHHTAVLGATGMGSRLYTQAGFREVGKLSFWKYGKMRQLA